MLPPIFVAPGVGDGAVVASAPLVAVASGVVSSSSSPPHAAAANGTTSRRVNMQVRRNRCCVMSAGA
jgi:hypothetical protein